MAKLERIREIERWRQAGFISNVTATAMKIDIVTGFWICMRVTSFVHFYLTPRGRAQRRIIKEIFGR